MVDPDLQIRGGGASHPDPEIRGGGAVSKKILLLLWASFWSKNSELTQQDGRGKKTANLA